MSSFPPTTSTRMRAPSMAGRPLRRQLGTRTATAPAPRVISRPPSVASSFSARTGKAAGPAFLGMQILETVGFGGRTPFHTLWWVTEGLDRLVGQKIYGRRLVQGPLADALSVGASASLTSVAASLVPGALKAVQSNAPHGGTVPLVKALVTRPQGKPALPGALTDAFKEVRHGTTLQAKAMGGMFIMQAAAFALGGASGVAGLVEHVAKPGPKNFLSTKTGRGALLGGISGATLLGMLAAHNTPLGIFSFLATAGTFTLQEMNTRGWIDGLLGADPTTAVVVGPVSAL